MRKYAPALVIDIVLVVVFAALGRRSHDETLNIPGIATTAWPFLAGLTVGWFATAGLYRDKFDARAAVPTGVLVWLCTLIVGMLLRAATGQGTATQFVIVATIFLGLFLVGWRLIARIWARRGASTR